MLDGKECLLGSTFFLLTPKIRVFSNYLFLLCSMFRVNFHACFCVLVSIFEFALAHSKHVILFHLIGYILFRHRRCYEFSYVVVFGHNVQLHPRSLVFSYR